MDVRERLRDRLMEDEGMFAQGGYGTRKGAKKGWATRRAKTRAASKRRAPARRKTATRKRRAPAKRRVVRRRAPAKRRRVAKPKIVYVQEGSRPLGRRKRCPPGYRRDQFDDEMCLVRGTRSRSRARSGTSAQKRAASQNPWVAFLKIMSQSIGVPYSEILRTPALLQEAQMNYHNESDRFGTHARRGTIKYGTNKQERDLIRQLLPDETKLLGYGRSGGVLVGEQGNNQYSGGVMLDEFYDY